jgi:sulfide:quinone oxidoreductase
MTSLSRYDVLIIGGGTAGITVAARLRRAAPDLSIAIVDPSDKHYYQPLWTLVGAGDARRESTERSEESVIPAGVAWIQQAAATFQPEAHTVTLANGETVAYQQLVVCPGIQLNWSAVKGLPETLGKNGVCSNYSYDTVEYTWECLRELRHGTALFTMPATPVKCGGAPQKIMYLAEDHVRRKGLRDQVNIIYATAGANLFGVAKYRAVLEKIVQKRGIDARYHHHLVEVRGAEKVAVFEHLQTREQVVIPFTMLHVSPPQSAPDFIRQSPLADAAGWCAADKYNLQHPRYPDIFALGDASSLPTGRTGAAIRKQAPVLVKNLLAHRAGTPLTARYDGYTSCPLVTRYGRMVLAEFDYEGNPAESFPFDQGKERYSMWLLKKYGLPLLYWYGMLKGRV